MLTHSFARRCAGAAAVIGGLCCAAALAAGPSPSPSPSDLPQVGHVVTSDRQDEPLRAAARTTYVITKAQIIARGYATIADAVASLPGVVVNRLGGFGALAGIAIRGASPAQTLLLLDGRPLAGALTKTLDPGELSTSGVERIEVVEGGGSTLYGAGAIGGIVNILTSGGAQRPLVRLGAGSFGETSGDIETRNFSFERLVTKNDFGTVSGLVPGGPRINDDFESTTARVRGDARLGRIAVQGSVGLSDVHLGAPGPLSLPFIPSSSSSAPTPNPSLPSSYASSTSRQNTSNADARATFSLEKVHATTTLDLAASRQLLQYYSAPTDPNGCFCNTLNRDTRLQLNMRNAVQSEGNRLVYGVDLAREVARIDAGFGAPPVHGFAQTAAYAQDDVSLGEASAYAGIRAERDGAQGGAFAPSVGGIAPLGNGFTLRANAAEGFRAPDAVDLYYPGFSNPKLVPERTQSTDFTLTDERILGGLSFGYFTLAGDNLIEVNPNFQFSQPSGPSNPAVVNVQRASLAGLTLAVTTQPLNGLRAVLGVTDLYRAFDLTSVAVRLPQRPVFTTNLTLEYGTNDPRSLVASGGVLVHAMGTRGAIPTNESSDPYLVAAPYTTVDSYLRFRLSRMALLTVRGDNLGNERYAAVAGYPAPGRALRLELSTR